MTGETVHDAHQSVCPTGIQSSLRKSGKLSTQLCFTIVNAHQPVFLYSGLVFIRSSLIKSGKPSTQLCFTIVNALRRPKPRPNYRIHLFKANTSSTVSDDSSIPTLLDCHLAAYGLQSRMRGSVTRSTRLGSERQPAAAKANTAAIRLFITLKLHPQIYKN